MTVKTSAVSGRRSLRFENLDQLRQDAETVTSRPFKTVGNWSASQIIDHLANSIRATYTGPERYAPWFVRWFIAPLIKSRMLHKQMPAGFNLPKKFNHILPDQDATVESALEKLRTWLKRLQAEAPPLGHPAFGKLTREDWIRLHLRHGELHLSFIIPD